MMHLIEAFVKLKIVLIHFYVYILPMNKFWDFIRVEKYQDITKWSIKSWNCDISEQRDDQSYLNRRKLMEDAYNKY